MTARNLVIVAVLGCLAMVGTSFGAAVTWTATGATGNWNDVSGWDVGVPANTSDVYIVDGPVLSVTVDTAAAGQASNLNLGGGSFGKSLILAKGLTVANAFAIGSNGTFNTGTGTFALSVGTLTNNGLFQTPTSGNNPFTLSGTSFTNAAAGTVKFQNSSASTDTLSIDVLNQGVWMDNGTNQSMVYNGLFVNQGTYTRSSNSTQTLTKGLTNSSGASMTILGVGILNLSATYASTNNGVITVNAGNFGGQNTAIGKTFNNNGMIYTNGGALNMCLINSAAGTVNALSGTTSLNSDGSTSAGSGFFHGGTLLINAGATVNNDGNAYLAGGGQTMSMAVINNGVYTHQNGGNAVTFTSGSTFQNNAGASFRSTKGVSIADNFNNNGTVITLAGGNITMTSGASMLNQAGGTIYMPAGQLAGTMTNQGLVLLAGGNFQPYVASASTGTIKAISGTSTIDGAGKLDGGLILVSAGATVNRANNSVAYTKNQTTPAVNYGVYTDNVNGSGLNYQAGASFANKAGASYIQKSNGVNFYANFTNEGYAEQQKATMVFLGGATFTNASGATLNFPATGSLTAGDSGLINHGQILMAGTSGTISTGWINDTDGSFTVTTNGHLSAPAQTSVQNKGVMTVATGGTMYFDNYQMKFDNTGTLNVAGKFTDYSALGRYYLNNKSTGVINMQGGTISADPSRITLSNGSQLSGYGTVGSTDYATAGQALTSTGNITATGTGLKFVGLGGLANTAGGTLTAAASSVLNVTLNSYTQAVTLAPGSQTNVLGTLAIAKGGFVNNLTDTSALNWRNGTLLLGDGNAAGGTYQTLETASQDLGATNIVLNAGNFNLGTLNVQSNYALRLTNGTANQANDSAMYVENLNIGTGASVDLNGLKLYAYNITGDTSGVIGGSIQQITRFNADANNDGKVDVLDLGILATNWQRSGANWEMADFNHDGVVDVLDLGILATNWQSSAGSFEAAAAQVGLIVPEPATLALLGLGATALIRRRK